MAEQSAAAPGRVAHRPAGRAEARPGTWPTVAAVSAGGVLGALARYGVTVALPHPPGTFAWATLLVNVSGCLLIGVLMTLIAEVWPGRGLLRPFWGVGVLGGYTTFSGHILDLQQMLATGAAGAALAYLAATLAGALAAVWAGAAITARAVRAVRTRRGAVDAGR